MTRFAIALSILAPLVQTPPALAQDLATQIVGVWKATSIARKEVASGNIDKPYGEKPTAYYIYTRGGHFSWSYVAESRKAPSGSAPTDAERVDLFKSMSFGTGTYKIVDNKIVQKHDSSWVQSWTGTERTIAAPEFAGNTMTVTTPPFKHPITGVDAFTITAWEKLE